MKETQIFIHHDEILRLEGAGFHLLIRPGMKDPEGRDLCSIELIQKTPEGDEPGTVLLNRPLEHGAWWKVTQADHCHLPPQGGPPWRGLGEDCPICQEEARQQVLEVESTPAA